MLVTALSTSSTLHNSDSGLHSTTRSISVVSAGDTLPATAETSNRAIAEKDEMLRILDENLGECMKKLVADTERNRMARMWTFYFNIPACPGSLHTNLHNLDV